jgi:hypothetical protein
MVLDDPIIDAHLLLTLIRTKMKGRYLHTPVSIMIVSLTTLDCHSATCEIV